MPKEYDVKRNYYADLDLPTTASLDDVKKQYRKLALLYHPDRNAGKEVDYIAKFQAIQSAHEIIGDPAKKILYDADRRKQTQGPSAGLGPRGNPYQASSNFPPPPRRTEPGTYRRPPSSQPRPAQNGANRFSGFAGAAPPPPPRPDPAQDRSNMFKAWQNMNTAQDRQQSRNNAGSGPSTPNEQPRRPQPPPRQDTKYPTEETARPTRPPYDADGADGRRSAWQAFNHAKSPKPGVRRSNTAKTPRKQGFDPNAPGSDERPASGSYYFHRHKSEDFGQPSPGSHAKGSRRPNIDPTRPNRAPVDAEDAPFAEGTRERTPYSSYIGEKTDPGLRRSKSSRDTAAMNEPSSPVRPRSTSPKSNAGRTFDIPSTDSEDGSAGDDSGSGADSAFSRQPNFHRPDRPKKQPSPPSRRVDREGRARAQEFSPAGTTTKDNMYVSPPRDTPATPKQFDAAQWRAGMFGSSSTGVTSASKKCVPAWAIPYGLTGRKRKPLQQDMTASPHKAPTVMRASNCYVNMADHKAEEQYATTVPPSTGDTNHTPSSNLPSILARTRTDTDYSFRDGPPHFFNAPTSNGKSRSEENINLKFAQPWNGTFEGNSTAFPPVRKPTNGRHGNSRTRATFGQPSPLGTGTFADTIPPPPPGPAPLFTTSPESNTFSSEHHEEAFKNYNWGVPPPSRQTDGKTTSPTDASPRQQRRASAQDQRIDTDEMDIDDSPPVKQSADAAAMPPPPKPIRMVSVPPSAWHQHQAGNPHHVRAASSGQAPSRHSDLRTSLDDFAHVEPFARPIDAGLKNFADLSANLPFKSQASNALPTQQDVPTMLELPPIPTPPVPPQHLTKQTWHGYSTAFAIYVKHFHAFNARILNHLTVRENLAQRKISQGMGWLEATGDVAGESGLNGPTGFASYAREVQEDVRVREVWSVGCDRHVQAVKAFEGTREKVRRLVNGGGLAER